MIGVDEAGAEYIAETVGIGAGIGYVSGLVGGPTWQQAPVYSRRSPAPPPPARSN